MVGGEVIEVIPTGNKIWINCQEVVKHEGQLMYQTICAIYIERNETSEKIKIGDRVWWQGKFAMWTPSEVVNDRKNRVGQRCGIDFDIQIPKVSNSGALHPAQLMIERAYEDERE